MASNSRPAVEQMYLDDLYVGQRFTSGSYRMDEADMVRFAAEFDPLPFHLDRSAAESSVFRRLAASGWHSAAVAMRLLVAGGLPLAEGIIGLGGEIACPSPHTRRRRALEERGRRNHSFSIQARPGDCHRPRNDAQSGSGDSLHPYR